MKAEELRKLGYKRSRGRLKMLEPGLVLKAPERVLEAVRLAGELDRWFEPETEQELQKAAKKLASVGPRRMREPWSKFAAAGLGGGILALLDRLGGVEALLPEIHAMKGVEQPPEWHPEGDVWVHTLLCLDLLGEANALVATAALLHDVGKPPTFEVRDRIRFSRHDSLGARMAERIARRLGFHKREREDIGWIIGSHMKFKHVREMRPGRLRRFVLDDRFEALAAVVRADCLASHGDTSDVDFALDARHELLARTPRPKPLLRGRDLVKMGFQPGPAFGQLLNEIERLRSLGHLTTTSDAKIFARNFLEHSMPDAK